VRECGAGLMLQMLLFGCEVEFPMMVVDRRRVVCEKWWTGESVLSSGSQYQEQAGGYGTNSFEH
jgi:hypothetical protein